jgi:hypothetical protein
MPFALRAVTVALAGGLFFASLSAAAQSQGEQKPADPQKAAEEMAKRAKEKRELAEAAKLPKGAGLPECLWTGRLAAYWLSRRDADSTKRFMDLYDRFSCPPDHLKLAMRCTIRLGLMDQKSTEDPLDRAHACWVNPDTTTFPLAQ